MNKRYVLMILKELEKYEDVEFIEMNNYSIKLRIHDHEVEISGEICACHGGRLSINIVGVGFTRLETYRYPDGIENGDQEMEWHIKENMVNAIDKLMNFKFVKKTWSKFRNNDNDVRVDYYQDEQDVISTLGFKSDKITLLDIEKGDKITPPNPNMWEKVELVERIDNGLRFEIQSYEKEDDVVKKRNKQSEIVEVYFYNKGRFQLKPKEEVE